MTNKNILPEDQSELMKEIILDYKEKYKRKDIRRLWYSFVFGYFGYKNWGVTNDCLGLDDEFDKIFKECANECRV